MRTVVTILRYVTAWGLLALAAASCNPPVDPEQEAAARLSLVVSGDIAAVATKASDVTEALREKVLSRLDVFLFSSTELICHEGITSVTLDGEGRFEWPTDGEPMEIPAGSYTVYVVANCPAVASMTSLSAIRSHAVSLSSDNDLSGTSGFVMRGSAEVTLDPGDDQDVDVALDRLVSRIRIKRITNDAAFTVSPNGGITVHAMFLENAPGGWVLDGTKNSVTTWINLAGRKSGLSASTSLSDYITASSHSNPAAMTSYVSRDCSVNIVYGGYKEASDFSDPYFYCFPNPRTMVQDQFDGPISSGTAQTRLVIYATVCGANCWYPITLTSGMDENTSYDVSVIIRGTGSDDPNKPLVKGTVEAYVDPVSWVAGSNYSEDL